ncbi:MAG: hypothetical protein AB7I08_12195 [Thermoleophilia bacterium]
MVSAAVLAGALLAGCGGGGDDGSRTAPPASGWQPPVTLPAPAPPPGASTAVRADGGATAVWVARRPGGVHQVLAAERAADGSWGAGVPVAAESPTTISGAVVTVDGEGTVTAAWSLWDRPSGAVFSYIQTARRPAGGEWGEVQTLSRGTNGASRPLVTSDAPGRAMVVWAGSTRRNGAYHPEVRSAHRAADGTWTLARIASHHRGDGFLPDDGLAPLPGGRGTRLIWTAFPRLSTPGGVYTATSRPDGRWSPPRLIAEEDRPSGLAVATGTDGTTTAVWSGDDGAWMVRARGRGWTTPVRVPGGPAGPEPELAAGDAGEAVMVTERHTGRGRTELRATWIGADGTAGPGRTLARSASGRGEPVFGLWSPSVAVGDDGRALVTWTRARFSPDGPIVADTIAARTVPPDGPPGPVETVLSLTPPVSGLLHSVAPLPGGAYQVRWRVEPSGGPPQASTRIP